MSDTRTKSKRKRLQYEDKSAAQVKPTQLKLKVINLDKSEAETIGFEYRAGKPYGMTAPPGARGHTPGHLVYYPTGKTDPFVGVRFVLGSRNGALARAVYTDSNSNKHTVAMTSTKSAFAFLIDMVCKLPNLPKGVDKATVEKLFLTSADRYIKFKCTNATKIENRDEDHLGLVVNAGDLANARLQVVATLKFNTSPIGKTSLSLMARSIAIFKIGERAAQAEENHDDLISMAI